MGTLAVSFTIFCLCIAAVISGDKDDDYKVNPVVGYAWALSIIVFTARVLGFVLEKWGW